MGAGFSFTPDEDGSSAGEDQPKDPPRDPPMPADAAGAASSACGADGGESQVQDPPTHAGVPESATAGAASGGRQQGQAAGLADGSGGGGEGRGRDPAAAGGSDVVANGGAEGGDGGELGPVHGVDLEHGFRLASADGLATPFTNYVRGCGTEVNSVTYPHSSKRDIGDSVTQ